MGAVAGEPGSPVSHAPQEFVAAAGKVLRAYKLDQVANLATEKLSTDNQVRSAVVVGEVKRGKSSLVNALIGHRDLTPVGVDVTSTIPLSVTPATDDNPAGPVHLLFPDHTREVDGRELADWATVDGRYVRDPQIESLPTRAIIPVAGSALGDVTVIDTPGVGGLDPALSKLAVQSAQQACVVVIVCDASTPLTAPEMAFIKDAGASVDGLIVAVTKTDKNIRRWKAIVGENRRLLQHHLQRDVTVLGVSSVRALIAAQMPPGPAREHAEKACGISELRQEIRNRLSVAERLPARDAVRTALEGLRSVRTKVADEIAVVEGRGKDVADLTDELERLRGLKEHSREWEHYLTRDLTMIRGRAIEDLDGRLDKIRDNWTTRINKQGMEVLRKSPQKFTSDMHVDLQMAMAGALSGFLGQLHNEVVMPRFGSEVIWNEICEQIVSSLSDRRIEAHQVGSKRQGLLDPSMLTMGVMGSSMIGGIIGVSTVLGVGAVVGGVWVAVNLGFRAMRSGKTNLLTWLRETIATTKTATTRLLEQAMANARPEIVLRYREHLRASIETLQERITSTKDAEAADAATRTKNLERLAKNLEIVNKRIADAEALLTELSPAPDAPESAVSV
ncbi:dynamin family protein [Williamsia sp.]|uniref:dynamin family protein n=1 Tax=Williamsia sp. TaxID=1872085 RepID=UPI0039C8ECD6